jgi:hypothetical protein
MAQSNVTTVTSMNALFKDMYPLPGTRLKQWVVDSRREAAWENDTCPRFDVAEHDDNTGTLCRNVGRVPWTFLNHDCCHTCNEQLEAIENGPQVQAWLAAKAARPPIEQDRSKLSDEVQPDYPPMSNPFLRKR